MFIFGAWLKNRGPQSTFLEFDRKVVADECFPYSLPVKVGARAVGDIFLVAQYRGSRQVILYNIEHKSFGVLQEFDIYW